jgi:hypothetical protein
MSSSTYLLAGRVSELERLICQKLIAFICEAFARWGDAEAGRKHRELLRSFDIKGNVRAEVLALPPGHPYLQLPLHLSVGSEPRLRSFVDTEELNQLNREAEKELQEPKRWGTTFTVIQSWGQRPSPRRECNRRSSWARTLRTLS